MSTSTYLPQHKIKYLYTYVCEKKKNVSFPTYLFAHIIRALFGKPLTRGCRHGKALRNTRVEGWARPVHPGGRGGRLKLLFCFSTEVGQKNVFRGFLRCVSLVSFVFSNFKWYSPILLAPSYTRHGKKRMGYILFYFLGGGHVLSVYTACGSSIRIREFG